MVHTRPKVYRTYFRDLPLGALFTLSADGAGPYIKISSTQYRASSAGGGEDTTVATNTAVIKYEVFH